MTTAAPPKTNASKPGTNLKSQKSHAEPRPAAQKPDSAAADCADTQGAVLTTRTTLELLESSAVDLSVDPQESVDDVS